MADDLISRQAAIDALYHVDEYNGRSVEAIRNFPSAQPGCEDAVSRKWLVEAVEEGWIKFDIEKDYNRYIHLVRDIAPSVAPKQPGWIPCSERLPEEDTEVLISYRYKEGEGDTDHVNIDITSYGTVCFGGREIHTLKEWRQPFDYFHANYEVIAWMPLPECYRGENDGQ